MIKKILLLVLLLVSIKSFSQNKDILNYPDSLKSIVPYGTFEYALAGNKDAFAVVDIIPRVGVKGEWAFDDNDEYSFFTVAEIGLHLTKRNDYIELSPDPGLSFGKSDNALYARLGFIGISTPYGRISIGKQWGVHYTLAGNIDNMYMFGGDAIGVYNAGTDGGSAGTGRADQAVKYEYTKGKFYVGLQSQFYGAISDSISGFGSSSIASYYIFGKVKVGASYSQVFDGIVDPEHGEAIYGDQYASILIDFNKENFHFGIIAAKYNQHEKDDVGNYFNGIGVEYNLKYNFGKKKQWAFVNNSSINLPDADQNMEYVQNRYAFEIARRFSVNTVMIAGVRIDNTTLSDGTKSGLHTFALGFYYNFNYPAP